MKISRYFTDLMATYVADIEDLKTDSGGDDVLAERLKERRSMLPDLMPMMTTNPELVAVVFHKSIIVKNSAPIMRYLDKEPAKFPAWDTVSSSVQFQPWATKLVENLKSEVGGEQFLLTAVMLEYLYGMYEVSEDAIEEVEDDESEDLAEAGGEWLTEHGFDSH